MIRAENKTDMLEAFKNLGINVDLIDEMSIHLDELRGEITKVVKQINDVDKETISYEDMEQMIEGYNGMVRTHNTYYNKILELIDTSARCAGRAEAQFDNMSEYLNNEVGQLIEKQIRRP